MKEKEKEEMSIGEGLFRFGVAAFATAAIALCGVSYIHASQVYDFKVQTLSEFSETISEIRHEHLEVLGIEVKQNENGQYSITLNVIKHRTDMDLNCTLFYKISKEDAEAILEMQSKSAEDTKAWNISQKSVKEAKGHVADYYDLVAQAIENAEECYVMEMPAFYETELSL